MLDRIHEETELIILLQLSCHLKMQKKLIYILVQ
nr:MAG TPA: hypothetical protein [Caudoviricetes sp.]